VLLLPPLLLLPLLPPPTNRRYDVYECARTDDAAHVENFLAAGEDLHKTRRIAGKEWLPVHFAAKHGALECVKRMIAKDKTLEDQRDDVNKGVLHHAAV
jgi:hypothetical protein